MRLANVVGTRPQLIKAAALQPALRERHEEVLIDTGQHWDETMAGTFFGELGLRSPDRSLGIGGGTAAEQTGRMLVALEGALRDVAPDAVVVYGDTNSTLAATLVAAKLDVPVAHVEAGLRSFDRRMPEEINRVVTDHLARWCFAPTEAAIANLAAEGLTSEVHLVGDVMRDLAARTLAEVRDPVRALGRGRRWPANRGVPVRDRASGREPGAGRDPRLGRGPGQRGPGRSPGRAGAPSRARGPPWIARRRARARTSSSSSRSGIAARSRHSSMPRPC